MSVRNFSSNSPNNMYEMPAKLDKMQLPENSKFLTHPTQLAERFKPKEEYTRMKFDPNVRPMPGTIPNKLTFLYLNEGAMPTKEPVSAYVAVNVKGETWHLFNAARIPLGRMANMIATFIRGKHKREYV